MELPSIKLNILKKLEYFLVLKKLNQQFDAQFKIVCDPSNNSTVLPTWEIEKKILFWSYGYHKHLGSPLETRDFDILNEDNKLDDIFITQQEIGGKKKKEVITAEGKTITYRPEKFKKVFGNLVQRGFAIHRENTDEYLITKEGLAFGELLWFLYTPHRVTSGDYFDKYGAKYILKENKKAADVLKIQLCAIYGFYVLGTFFLTIQVLDIIGILDDVKATIMYWYWLGFIIKFLLGITISVPFVLFCYSLYMNCRYENSIEYKNKYQTIEKLKVESLKNEN